MIDTGIIGGSGYTGGELLRILSKHPEVRISAVTSERFAGKPIKGVFPFLRGVIDSDFEKFFPEKISRKCDLIFLALPHKVSMSAVPKLLKKNIKIIDLSADYRIKDKDIYKEWYGEMHQSPKLLDESVYGLPELHRDAIKKARIVANPGCYPTSIILALAPLMKSGLIDSDTIVIDSKSGTSGAGRRLNLGLHFSESYNSVRGYNVTGHRHIPEIEQELSLLAKSSVKISFAPHVVPMSRGILSTIFVKTKKNIKKDALIKKYREFYRNEPFIRVLEQGQLPDTHHVVGSNFCDIGMDIDSRNDRLIILSAIDNLVKGASGQAVQNMNIMYNFKEEMGLNDPGIFP